MKCPACQQQKLSLVSLEDVLQALECRACGGQWLSSKNYWKWLQKRSSDSTSEGLQPNLEESLRPRKQPCTAKPCTAKPCSERHLVEQHRAEAWDGKRRLDVPEILERSEISDRGQAGICPTCDRILLRHRIGHQISFRLEQCGACNGIWLDAHKWDMLKTLNLHHLLHKVKSAPWQANLRRQGMETMLESLHEQEFQGQYPQLKQIKQWLKAQPDPARMLDYLVHETL